MKRCRWISLLLVIVMVMTTLPVVAQTGTAGKTDDRASSNDIVIVIDHSTSMLSPNGSVKNPADRNGYRFDAAELIVGMCDMENSRVAIVPFAGSVLHSADTEFADISDVDTRLKKIDEIERVRTSYTNSNTDMGTALCYSLNLLLGRKDTDNAPMIIVITDGKNDMRKSDGTAWVSNHPTYVWDEQRGCFVDKMISRYNADTANERQDEAVEIAARFGIPIYTVALQRNATTVAEQDEVKAFTDILHAIADKTGGQCIELGSADAKRLPEIFSQMFATQIGSMPAPARKPVLVDSSNMLYEVTIPILNASVLEANIYIPLDNIRENSITLKDPTGHVMTNGGQDVVRMSSPGRFVMYKIFQPRETGDWTLQFGLKDEKSSVDDISFNLLYNYDITLKSAVGTSFGAMNQPGDGISLNKGDDLYISSKFYMVTENGDVPSMDKRLYTPSNGEDWETIKVNYELLDKVGTVIWSGELLPEMQQEYRCMLPLGQIDQNADGYNDLQEGQYWLSIVADGAGLYRTTTLPVTIVNQAPVFHVASPSHRIVVNDPTDPESQSPREGEIDLSQWVYDPDGDALVIDVNPVNDAARTLKVSAVRTDAGGWKLVYNTLMDPQTGLIVSCPNANSPVVYTLVAQDSDGARVSADCEFYVTSDKDETLDQFKCHLETEGLNNDGQGGLLAEKGAKLTFRVNLTDAGGTADTTGKIREFMAKIIIYDGANRSNTVLGPDDLTLNAQGTHLEYEYVTGVQSGKFDVELLYYYGNYDAGKETLSFHIENAAPVVETAAEETLPTFITYEELPVFLSFLGKPTPEEVRTIDLTTLFHDGDNEALIYEQPVITDGKGNAADAVLGYQRVDDMLVLEPKQFGYVTLTLRAIDGDNMAVVCEVQVLVISLVWIWLGILALAVLLILLIIVICLALRPRFAPGTKLHVRVNEALSADQHCEIPRVKKAISLAHYIEHEIAMRGNVTPEDLAQLNIKPTRSRSGSVQLIRVMKKKAFVTLSVQLNGTELGKKPLIWAPDAEVVVRHSGDDGQCLRLTLVVGEMDSVPGESASDEDLWGANEAEPVFLDGGNDNNDSQSIDW